ncbi:ABC transporter-like [Theobroma cacao]|nr:ABC transporter-like [Theobroma cacao]
MESGEPYRASSLRIGSSKLWRSNSMEVFSKSFQEEDDEEALKWAAIEKLPTFSRIRTGILAEEGRQLREVDIKNLGLLERRNLVERLVKVAGEDHEKFLLRLRERIDQVGINLPTIEVRFEHLNVEAEAYEGSRALPTVFNYCVNMFEGFLNYLHILPSKKKTLPILKDVSGIIRPQRMALLLGPPSSGKTTLLLALAGKLRKELKISGRVTYNGHEMEEFVPQRTSAYISQYDVHIGEMTVRETLAFSARCQGVGPRYDMLVELARREKAANIKPDPDIDIYMKAAALEGQETSVVTDYILKILGLEVCADTMVGDEMIRGISGGQKKRVTTGEMLVGPAKALFMDEISTGLDSSTTFQIVNALRQSIHILNGTAVISLLQPAPETYDLFDDIILLSDGQIAYQGPRENVLEFFEYMGFKCPERKGVADFLQEVNSNVHHTFFQVFLVNIQVMFEYILIELQQVTSRKDQEQYWVHKNERYTFVTAKQFAEEFQSFQIGQKLNEELATPFDKSQSHPAALATEKYGVSQKQLLKACISRDYLLMKRNLFVYAFKVIQLIFTAFITMTLFLKVDMHRNSVIDGGIFMGALFFTLMVIMLNGVSEISMTIIKLPVFYKQRDFLFYPSWAYALTTWIMKIPITLIEVTIWIVMTYYVIGFDPNVGRLLRQYLLLLCLNQMASGLFRLLAAVGRNMIVANTCGSLALLAISAMGGFILSRDGVKKWWLWGYWVSPLMYAQNSIAVNEFLGKSWRHHDHCKINADQGKESPRSPSSRPPYARMGSFDEASQPSRRGTVLPFEPFSITFDEIRYAVDMPQEMKEQGVPEDRLELLKGVSGAFRPGVLTALMGVSGAGKTTLMDVLAGRKTGGYIDGSITISGYPKKQETFARISGYCEQTDVHSPYVTVYESLLFSAWLRLPLKVNSEARKTVAHFV